MAPSNDMKAFQEILKSSKNIIAVAGAGLSAASGIPTFRGTGGMWRKYDAISMATPEAFRTSPSLVWQFYHFRRESALQAHPNDAHKALSAFSLSSIRHMIAPDSKFTLITQNVDGLSPRANQEVATLHLDKDDDEPHLIEMHGRLFDVICPYYKCKHVEINTNSPVCDALFGNESLIEGKVTDPQIDIKLLPRCSECGRLARPGVVWFGEMPHHLDEIEELVDKADLCLVIGTSSTVNPAASYAHMVQCNGGITAVFNLEHSEGDKHANFLFLGPCEDTLPEALGICISEENGTLSIYPMNAH